MDCFKKLIARDICELYPIFCRVLIMIVTWRHLTLPHTITVSLIISSSHRTLFPITGLTIVLADDHVSSNNATLRVYLAISIFGL
jgi:hypothetical protein